MSNQIQKLVKHSKYPQLLTEVFKFAKTAYGDKKRLSGESYLDHATNVALILFDMGLDQTTVVGGLLHDVTDISSLSPEKKCHLAEIEKRFGREIANIVERSSEIKRIYYSFYANKKIDAQEHFFEKEKAENLRKMFLAIARDLRVVLIELASRIDGLNNIEKLPQETQKLYATETLEIFVPIANRLGLGKIKTSLEDLSFAYLDPEKFAWLQENIKEKHQERQAYLKKFIPALKKILASEKVEFLSIDSRAKGSWGTYKKLLSRQMDFEKIHDLVALRIIVKDIADCYKTLGIIHKHYKPISSEKIKDYITKPKINGYQSLHTTVFLEPAKISEIQIRTAQMHQEAEFGVCAHWSYKESVNLQKAGAKNGWASKVPEFWKTFNIDFFADQIFTFTPKGDIIALPKGSTPIDFAYAIHSDIGNHCESAKIDGNIIPLSQALKNGDVVEIITNKKRKPSYDWLRFVKTGFAKSHIRKLITSIPLGIFSVPKFVTKKIFEISKKAQKRKAEKVQIKKDGPGEIYLAGQKGIVVNVAKCCLPQPADQVKAYLTKHRAAVLHKISCQNLQKISQKFPEKIIDASWQKS